MAWSISFRNGMTVNSPVEVRGLVQAVFAADSVADAAAIQIQCGLEKIAIGDIFQIQSMEGDRDYLRFEGDFSAFNGLGFGLSNGRIEIRGNAGARTGGELSGGLIEIHGDCGPWCGVAAAKGRINISGNAGDWLGAHWPGETVGVKGAEIIVQGNAGDHAGARMRRGLLAIGGDVGVGLGRAMVAGSIFAAGNVAGPVGNGMKRGSIVLNHPLFNLTETILPSFTPAGEFRPLSLNLQLDYLAKDGWGIASEFKQKLKCERFFGDRLSLGLGELLVLS